MHGLPTSQPSTVGSTSSAPGKFVITIILLCPTSACSEAVEYRVYVSASTVRTGKSGHLALPQQKGPLRPILLKGGRTVRTPHRALYLESVARRAWSPPYSTATLGGGGFVACLAWWNPFE